jgi:chromate reductase, NAD(P)H dehydrogenase (quinone)
VTKILLVSGSTRAASTNAAALRTAATLAPDGVTTDSYDGLAELPAFNPDDDGDRLPEIVAELRTRIAGADAVLFCTPEYAGNLPGSFKNLLDWTVGGGEMYEKPAAWINAAAEGRGGGATAALKAVLGYLGATVIEPACREIPVDRKTIGPDGLVQDPQFTAGIAEVWQAILNHLGPEPPRAGLSGFHPVAGHQLAFLVRGGRGFARPEGVQFGEVGVHRRGVQDQQPGGRLAAVAERVRGPARHQQEIVPLAGELRAVED